MAKLIKLEPSKTYASEKNAVKAFEDKFGDRDLRYVIIRNAEGRYFPVCLFGDGRAMQEGVHFHFCVMG